MVKNKKAHSGKSTQIINNKPFTIKIKSYDKFRKNNRNKQHRKN